MSNIILLNGPSSAGKSTLARAFQDHIDVPFLWFSFDLFLDSGVLPMRQIKAKQFDWQGMRPRIFDGLYHCVQALAHTQNNLIMDHIIESAADLRTLVTLLRPFDVFFVGIHCSLAELERREIARGNRRLGDARADLAYVHTFSAYDFEIDAENPLEENVALLTAAWREHQKPTQFNRLAENFGQTQSSS